MAVYDIAWDAIAPGSRSSWFIHGFNANQAVTLSIVVFGGPGPVFKSVGHATLTQGESMEHVDGTKAYKIHIQNNSANTTTDVHILAQVESL